jgi:hypothetical protein
MHISFNDLSIKMTAGLKMNTKTLKTLAAGFFILSMMVVAVYGVTSSLKVVSDSYGFRFFLGASSNRYSSGDPLVLYNNEQGYVQMIVWASPPYPDVYFKAYIDGAPIGEGYGTGRMNVVEFSIPIQGSNYEIGNHQITGSAKVANNPELQNTASLIIKDSTTLDPQPTTYTAPQTPTQPKALLTAKIYDNPPADGFNLISIFDSANQKIALSATTPSKDGTHHYIKQTLTDGETYKVQAECTGYITQIQTVTLNGDTTIEFHMQPLPVEQEDTGAGIPAGEVPTGELNPNAATTDKPWYQFILDFFSFNWLHF